MKILPAIALTACALPLVVWGELSPEQKAQLPPPATRPVDFRKGMDGLAALVQQALRADPFAGDVFIFRPKRADRVKILVYDGTGLCLYAKRLEAGRFSWPSPADGVVRLSAAQLATLLEGHQFSLRMRITPVN